jgi:phytoene dehydrogenase-like protein
MESDIVVVGAGHNALTCAAYLARTGLDVVVLEARARIGGNTMTEELTLPGWQHDSCSSAHVVIQSNPLLADDELGLISTYGLRYVVTDPAVVIPVEGGDALVIRPDLEATAEEFARYSPSDARALREMIGEWDAGLKHAHARYQAGVEPADGVWSDRYDALRARSAWDVVAETFQHPVLRRAVMWTAFATIQPPERSGTGALPAAILAGRLRFGWATPVGGSGALAGALTRYLGDHGGTVVTSAEVSRFLVLGGQCAGVETADGRLFRARHAVVTSSHVTSLPDALDAPSAQLLEAASRWRPGLSVFAVHFALRDHVRYRTREGRVTSVAGGLGSPEGLARQVRGALAGEVDAADPWLLMVDSTVVDPARAPGAAFKFLTVAPMLFEGAPWSAEAARRFADGLVDVARRHVDGLDDDNVLATHLESPTTLAARNPANVGGSCHGGEFLLDDGSVIPGWPEVRSGVPGLYLTGSTSHPGGSVSGHPGRNAARVVLGDLGRAHESLWTRP